MSEMKDQTLALNVRLKPSEPSAHPKATNYANVGVAQGIAYVDFGFIEPTVLAAIAKTAKDGQPAPKGLDGHLVTRVAMPRMASCVFISRSGKSWLACARRGSQTRRRKPARGRGCGIAGRDHDYWRGSGYWFQNGQGRRRKK